MFRHFQVEGDTKASCSQDFHFDMVITDLTSKLLKLENPIIKRAAGREKEERKRGRKEERRRKR